jgi:hypothetical protein
MLSESLAMEHYRLHVIEQWPEGAKKDAGLASVRSALRGLLAPQGSGAWVCMVCGSSEVWGAARTALAATAR